MNRIAELFNRKQKGILSVYMTAGYPKLSSTTEIIHSLQESGADMVEIGMPFSDPLADGPVIQQSSQVALNNGMTIKLLFEQLTGIRSTIDMPLVLMGYLNPVLQFGYERFIEKCVATGIDGLILPDLPLSIYNKDYRSLIEDAGISFIMLITPQTSEERIREIASSSRGFLYMVADSSTTGARNQINEKQIEYFKRINAMGLSIPRLIGFGISSRETFNMAGNYASGAIIGSAFIHALSQNNGKTAGENSAEFVRSIIL